MNDKCIDNMNMDNAMCMDDMCMDNDMHITCTWTMTCAHTMRSA